MKRQLLHCWEISSIWDLVTVLNNPSMKNVEQSWRFVTNKMFFLLQAEPNKNPGILRQTSALEPETVTIGCREQGSPIYRKKWPWRFIMTQYWYSCIVSLTVCNFVIFYAVLRLFAQCWTFKIQFGTFLSQNQNLAYFWGKLMKKNYLPVTYGWPVDAKIYVVDYLT